MLLINCPWCGPRDDGEFTYGGQAHIARPNPSELASDADWAEYLFMRTNPRGLHREQWQHSAGCRQWFNVERDTVSYRIGRVYRCDEPSSTDPQ
jgi:heterotetrameric sarcosine oxidase delta subunit